MVTDTKEDSDKPPVKQGPEKVSSEPNKIGPATPYDFDGKNLTAYGGLLPVGTLLEKIGFRQLVEETLKVKRQTRAMPAYQLSPRTDDALTVYLTADDMHPNHATKPR